jgi:hypothetical protein
VAGGFQVTVDSRASLPRRRFALAHEIGHMLFFDWTTSVPRQPFRSSRYWVQEGYALEIGRMLLTPRRMLADWIERYQLEPDLGTFLALCQKFDVSSDVMRRRLIGDLGVWDCIIFTSKIAEGEVATKSVDVSKGPRFHRVSIPRLLGQDEWSNFLRSCILSAVPGAPVRRTVSHTGMHLVVECRRGTGPSESSVTTLIHAGPEVSGARPKT